MTNRVFAVFVVALMTCGTAAGAAGGQPTRAADAAAPTEITSCTTISEPGTYVLSDDIENSSADACIRIRTSDVSLDGNGHVVDGVTDANPERLSEQFFDSPTRLLRNRTAVGVAVTADRSLSNVTVRDLTVTDWRWGVLASNLRAGGIVGVRATDNAFGVATTGSRSVAVLDAVASDNAGFGVAMLGVRRGRVTNVTASGNGVVGVFYSKGTSARISNVTARSNDFAGVLLDRTSGSTVFAATASGSRFGVSLFRTTATRVMCATATRNRVAGVYAANARETRITNATVTNNSLAGVLLDSTTDASVATTDASRGRYGIYLFGARDTSVADSTANRGVIGVYVRNATDGTVVNNTVLNNSFAGVYVENSTGVRVENNRDGTTTFESRGNATVGREGDYAHDSSISVNQSDGLSDAELRAYVYRAIARAEYLRQLEYTGSVSFELVSQAELERRTAAEPDPRKADSAWQNQLWEAAFVVGEDENATRILRNESTNVAGFYNALADKLVIVSDEDPLTVASTTLVHEFVHAIQDQHFDLSRPEMRPRTEDASRALEGLVEGDARYAEERFEQFCGVVWNCEQVASKEPPGGSISASRNFALRQFVLVPYSDGPGYVAQLRRRGGWAAVDRAYSDPPDTTEQILHPDRRNESAIPLSFADTARDGWAPFDQSNLTAQGRNGTTTLGEAAIYTMFWYQGYEYDNQIVDVREHLVANDGPFDLFDYRSAPSAGWGNDVLVPYRNDAGNETRYGYVWRLAWDTPKDAREFVDAYRQLLRGQGADEVGPNTWVIESGSFADAFRVVRDGRNVTIVNAPTVEALGDVRPGLARANESASDRG